MYQPQHHPARSSRAGERSYTESTLAGGGVIAGQPTRIRARPTRQTDDDDEHSDVFSAAPAPAASSKFSFSTLRRAASPMKKQLGPYENEPGLTQDMIDAIIECPNNHFVDEYGNEYRLYRNDEGEKKILWTNVVQRGPRASSPTRHQVRTVPKSSVLRDISASPVRHDRSRSHNLDHFRSSGSSRPVKAPETDENDYYDEDIDYGAVDLEGRQSSVKHMSDNRHSSSHRRSGRESSRDMQRRLDEAEIRIAKAELAAQKAELALQQRNFAIQQQSAGRQPGRRLDYPSQPQLPSLTAAESAELVTHSYNYNSHNNTHAENEGEPYQQPTPLSHKDQQKSPHLQFGPQQTPPNRMIPRRPLQQNNQQRNNFSNVQQQQYNQPQQQQRSAQANNVARNAPTAKSGITLIPVTVLPDLFRTIFKFPVFNAVQSKCFATLYKSDENMVISAPTGAGKTVLFEIAMIRCMQDSTSNKIVYMAPTKSLCGERVKDWQKKFSGATIKCVELTGDSDERAAQQAQGAQIIVTTPEKWDVVTRRMHNSSSLAAAVRLMCIDEVHLLAEERGSTLEVVVARMKRNANTTRFIAVSATVPNIEDVGVWLGPGELPSNTEPQRDAMRNRPMARVATFGDEFRPCPLQKIVMGFPAGNRGDHAFDTTLNFKLLEIIQKHSSGKPVLVFCNTRKGCMTAAQKLVAGYREACEKNRFAPPWPIPVKPKVQFEDKQLHDLAAVGVGVHNAGMSMGDRQATENLFLSNGIRVLCTTSTLAVGINLPARMVIIKNTKIWDANTGKNIDYTDLDILQMMGRAGRPQFDDHGIAIIMCNNDEKEKYEQLVRSENVLESCLHKTLTEHINSEITIGSIKSRQDAVTWLKNSFFFVRLEANPFFYRQVSDLPGDIAEMEGQGDDTFEEVILSAEERMEQLVDAAMAKLRDHGLTEEDAPETDNSETTTCSTAQGTMLCHLSVRFGTFVTLQQLPFKSKMPAILDHVAQAQEFKEIRWRSTEKQAYASLNERVRYKLEKIADPKDKVNILIQLACASPDAANMKIENANPRGEIFMILQHAKRIVKCAYEIAIYKKDALTAKWARELLMGVCGRAWDTHNQPMTMTGIHGVGVQSIDKLVAAGYRSIADLRKGRVPVIDEAMGRTNSSIGNSIICQAGLIADFEITVKGQKEKIEKDRVQVTFTAVLGIKNKDLKHTSEKGEKYEASLLIYRSDYGTLHHMRSQLWKIAKKDSASLETTVTVSLNRPSQKIICSVSVVQIPGTTVTETVLPETPASLFPLPEMFASEDDASVDLESIDAPIAKKPVSIAADPDKLLNGRYKCNHHCKNACSHECCREGLAKPRKTKRVRDEDDNGGAVDGPPKEKAPKKPRVKKTALQQAKVPAKAALSQGDTDETAPMKPTFRRITAKDGAASVRRLLEAPLPHKSSSPDVFDIDDDDLPDIAADRPKISDFGKASQSTRGVAAKTMDPQLSRESDQDDSPQIPRTGAVPTERTSALHRLQAFAAGTSQGNKHLLQAKPASTGYDIEDTDELSEELPEPLPVKKQSSSSQYSWKNNKKPLFVSASLSPELTAPSAKQASTKASSSTLPSYASDMLIDTPEYPDTSNTTVDQFRDHLDWMDDHINILED